MTHGAFNTAHQMAPVHLCSSVPLSCPPPQLPGYDVPTAGAFTARSCHPKEKGPSPRLEAPHLLAGSCISIFLLLLLVEAQLHDESAMPLELVMEMRLR